jgi:hypothetical protein
MTVSPFAAASFRLPWATSTRCLSAELNLLESSANPEESNPDPLRASFSEL